MITEAVCNVRLFLYRRIDFLLKMCIIKENRHESCSLNVSLQPLQGYLLLLQSLCQQRTETCHPCKRLRGPSGGTICHP